MCPPLLGAASWTMRDLRAVCCFRRPGFRALGLAAYRMERACVSFATLSISEYARRLASADPTPGGGSASAVAGALGASLVSMVARLTAASPAFTTHAERMRIVAERGERLSSAFLASSDEDVAAFDKVSAAYKLTKSTDAERTARTSAIQTALIGASDVPMHVVELALETV